MLGKKGLFVVLCLVVVALFVSVGVRNSSAAIEGGFHDLSQYNTGLVPIAYPNVRETCVFCHTPHGANRNEGYNMDPRNGTTMTTGAMNGKWLWNRAIPDKVWQVYDSTTYDATKNANGGPFGDGQPGLLSLMCLSCHDGVGAMNVMINKANNSADVSHVDDDGNQFGDGYRQEWLPLNIGDAHCPGNTSSDACTSGGDDLRNDHPIGFIYDDVKTVDGGLKDITNADMLKRMTLTSGRMECQSCHDPHITNTNISGTGYAGNRFLVMDNARSALCFQCHNK